MESFNLYGSCNPDMIANTLAEAAAQVMEKEYRDIYFDFSKSYLKGGITPVFRLGGSFSFDFRNKLNTKKKRHDIERKISRNVNRAFRNLFFNLDQKTYLDVVFDLNLVPHPNESKINEHVYSHSMLDLTNPPSSNLYNFKESLEKDESFSNDYTFMYYSDSKTSEFTVTCFEENMTEEQYEQIFENVVQYANENNIPISSMAIHYQWNPKGSLIFFSECGVSGKPIDYYDGIYRYSQQNPDEGFSGKHYRHPWKSITQENTNFHHKF